MAWEVGVNQKIEKYTYLYLKYAYYIFIKDYLPYELKETYSLRNIYRPSFECSRQLQH